MLVKKKVFGFHELDCSIEQVKQKCIEHFWDTLEDYVINCCDTRQLNDRDKFLEESQLISFDTNSIRFEIDVTKDEILSNDKVVDGRYHWDKVIKENTKESNELVTVECYMDNVLEYTSSNWKTMEKGPHDYDDWAYKIGIRIIEIGNTCYYFYVI